MTMLAVRRKPPGEEPEGSRPSATSRVVHPFLSRSAGVVRHLNCLGKRHCSHVQPGQTPERLTWLCPSIPADLLRRLHVVAPDMR